MVLIANLAHQTIKHISRFNIHLLLVQGLFENGSERKKMTNTIIYIIIKQLGHIKAQKYCQRHALFVAALLPELAD